MASNSSHTSARRMLLESLSDRPLLIIIVLTLMGVSAGATAGYAWVAGPALAALGRGGFLSSSPGSAASGTIPSAVQIVTALVCLGLLRALAETARARISARLQLGIVREFRGKILARALTLEPAAITAWGPGELASRIQVEVHGVRVLLHLGLVQGIRSVVVATALAIVAWKVDSLLATQGLIVIPIAAGLVMLAARPARRLQRRLFGAESELVADTGEAVDGALVLRAYGAVGTTLSRIDGAASRSERLGVSADTWAAMVGPIVELAAAAGLALVLAMSAVGQRSDLAATGTVLVALLLMYRPLISLAQATIGWFAGLSALDRLDELLALPTVPPVERQVDRGTISTLGMQGLRFAHGDRAVIDGASIRCARGELVVLTGASGAGKTTLLKLLGGTLTPDGGGVQIDGANALPSALASSSGWMPQTPALFGGTYVDNIALGDPAPDRSRVIDAARRANADGFIGVRPGGFDGVILEGGADLSVGQRQRICLARVIYRGAPIWLLDEPTAALDAEQERQIVMLCRDHVDRGGLVIVATHHPAWLRSADRVWTIEQGTVSECEQRVSDLRLN